jgi:DNA-binding PadR family transcriptional regulator
MADDGLDPRGLGREVVLGLVVERPDNCYQLDLRLQERFRSAGYSEGTSRQAMKRLLADGHVRALRSSKLRAAAGGRESTIYEPTDDGVAHFRAWMLSSVQPMPVREELTVRVGLCRQEDIPGMIVVVSDAEALLMTWLQGLNFRVRARRRDLDMSRWDTRIDLAISSADHAALDSKLKFVQELHRHLVEELSRIDEQGPRPPQPPR